MSTAGEPDVREPFPCGLYRRVGWLHTGGMPTMHQWHNPLLPHWNQDNGKGKIATSRLAQLDSASVSSGGR
jgi:hypothetical protein